MGLDVLCIFVKVDGNGKPYDITYKQQEIDEIREKKDKNYIEKQENISEIVKDKNYVTIDPNKSDLMYCMDKNGNKFRYTQNQRRKETRKKKYMKIREEIKINEEINGKTMKELESELSSYNSKTCDYNEFEKYLKKKNSINRLLFDVYEDEIHRKLKFNAYINTQKSESNMVKNFKSKFGEPDKCVVIMGDYDNGSYHMKGKEPAITNKIRKILRREKYEVYLINEFRTSKLCNKCSSEVETFQYRDSKRKSIWPCSL